MYTYYVCSFQYDEMNIKIRYDLFNKRYIPVVKNCHKLLYYLCSISINLYCALFGMVKWISVEDIYFPKRFILVVLKFKYYHWRVKLKVKLCDQKPVYIL